MTHQEQVTSNWEFIRDRMVVYVTQHRSGFGPFISKLVNHRYQSIHQSYTTWRGNRPSRHDLWNNNKWC
uniref:Uncharacterized protein n=1 Tax=Arundo donax TaxID=35708 RepID=A0A0A8ZE47_ARUDO